jgi:hypothetical protein
MTTHQDLAQEDRVNIWIDRVRKGKTERTWGCSSMVTFSLRKYNCTLMAQDMPRVKSSTQTVFHLACSFQEVKSLGYHRE